MFIWNQYNTSKINPYKLKNLALSSTLESWADGKSIHYLKALQCDTSLDEDYSQGVPTDRRKSVSKLFVSWPVINCQLKHLS